MHVSSCYNDVSRPRETPEPEKKVKKKEEPVVKVRVLEPVEPRVDLPSDVIEALNKVIGEFTTVVDKRSGSIIGFVKKEEDIAIRQCGRYTLE